MFKPMLAESAAISPESGASLRLRLTGWSSWAFMGLSGFKLSSGNGCVVPLNPYLSGSFSASSASEAIRARSISASSL